MIKLLKAFDAIVHRVNAISMKISASLIFLLMILTFVDVAGRITIRPATGTYELTYLLLAVIFYLGVGFTQLEKGHISIGFLIDRFPERIQACVDIVVYLLTLAIALLMGWRMFLYASAIRNSVSGELGLPVSIFVMVAACGVLIYAAALVTDFIKAVCKAVGINV